MNGNQEGVMINVGTKVVSICDIQRGHVGVVISVDIGCYTVKFRNGEEHLLFDDELKVCRE